MISLTYAKINEYQFHITDIIVPRFFFVIALSTIVIPVFVKKKNYCHSCPRLFRSGKFNKKTRKQWINHTIFLPLMFSNWYQSLQDRLWISRLRDWLKYNQQSSNNVRASDTSRYQINISILWFMLMTLWLQMMIIQHQGIETTPVSELPN